MGSVFVVIGSVTLAAAFLAFAWAMERRQRRNGTANDDSDDEAIVGMFPRSKRSGTDEWSRAARSFASIACRALAAPHRDRRTHCRSRLGDLRLHLSRTHKTSQRTARVANVTDRPS